MLLESSNLNYSKPIKCYSLLGRNQLGTVNDSCLHWKFVVHEKNYLPDCTAGEDEGKSGYFQCAVHLPVDK